MKLYDRSVYLLTIPSENYLQGIIIAIAPKYFAENEVGFLVTSPTSIGHHIVFDHVESSETEIVMRDAERVGDDGEPVYWKWEFLTHDRFATLGNHVSGHDEIMRTLTDTYMVQIFYLDYNEEWWQEKPSLG